MLRGLIIIFICTLFSSNIGAVDHYEFTPEARRIYNDILSLKLDGARADLENTLLADPGNGIYYLLENYHDLLETLILDDIEIFNRHKSAWQNRIKELKKGPETSPWYRYCQAEVMLQWSVLEYKYGNWWQSFNNVHKAYGLLSKNEKDFPEFMPTYRSLGLIHAFMGTISMSKSMRWIVKQLSGMYGSIEEGMSEMNRVLDYAESNDYVFADETRVIYAYMLIHVKNEEEMAWSVVKSIQGPASDGLLSSFVKADMALMFGKLDDCIETIDQAPNGNEYLQFNFLDLMKGLALLYSESDQAEQALKSFLAKHKGNSLHFTANQKLAWYYLIRGDESLYKYHIAKCSDKKLELLAGRDKEARREALSGQVPDPVLLKARILFDGRQYELGIALLDQYEMEDFNETNKLEYGYRLGRLKQGAGYNEEAILNLSETYTKGLSTSSFMVCNAALQVGLIYEKMREIKLAETWLKRALAHRPDSYKNSLHSKARTALKRMKLQTID